MDAEFAQKLASLARTAKEKQEEKRVAEADAEARRLAAKREAEIRTAEAIITTIESACLAAASKGKGFARIMKLEYGNFVDYEGYGKINGLSLGPRMVYDYLKDNGLNPKLEYEHDGVGEKSWYWLTANWSV